MRAVGIIAEYNPFHSGHRLHIEKARAASGCDAVIVAMSGAFTQRGDPALLDKWTRARMALMNGADMVFELPCLFALREAQGFAMGGAALLSGLGVVNSLCFGCEPEAISLIEPVARCLYGEDAAFKQLMSEKLSAGLSWPQARAEAASERLGFNIPNLPNFSLALEYAQANYALGEPLKLLPVERLGSHNDASPGSICSSSAIRSALRGGDAGAALAGMPEGCGKLLMERVNAGEACLSRALIDDIALIALRNSDPTKLKELPGVGEGLESLLHRSARQCASIGEALDACKSRRYTRARLGRIPAQLVLGIDRRLQMENPMPRRARLLGIRREAIGLLREIKERGRIELVTDATQIDRSDPVWQLEQRATDIWGMCTHSPAFRRAGADYTTKFMIVD